MNNLLIPQNLKVRSCRAIYYGDENVLKSICLTKCSHFAFIVHDKDKNEDGTDKKRHIHCLLRFPNQIYPRTIKAYFGEQLAAPAVFADSEFCRYWDYLTHKDELNKYIYDSSSIQCDDLSYWRREYYNHNRDPTDNSISISIINDLISGVSHRELLNKYGREIIINYDKYIKFLWRVREDDYNLATYGTTDKDLIIEYKEADKKVSEVF